MAALPGAERYRFSTGNGWSDVNTCDRVKQCLQHSAQGFRRTQLQPVHICHPLKLARYDTLTRLRPNRHPQKLRHLMYSETPFPSSAS